jgi:putative lipoprotein
MIRKYIFPLALATIALFFASVGCTRESLGDGGAHVGKNSLLLQLQVSPTALRATEVGEDAYNENTVSSITVLFYKGGQLFWQSKESGQGGIIPNGSITTPGRHYIIPVPDDKKAQLNGVNSFNVYVVCNKASFVAPATEAALLKEVVADELNATAPASFVMIGSATNKKIDMATQAGRNLGSIGLKRVAAKVRVLQPTVDVAGYVQVGDAQVKLRNYADRGYLATAENVPTAEYKTTDYRPVTEVLPNGGKAMHFYSYYNEWASPAALDQRPELMVQIKMKKEGESDNMAKSYYYKVPLEPEQKSLESNKLYKLSLRIEIIGSPSPENPELVTGAISIEEWSKHEDSYGLPATQFLVVAEHDVEIKNATQYSLPYQSSKHPITISIKKVYATFVDDQGVTQTISYTQGMAEFPTITFDANTIHINSSIPVNNVPKYIEFEVTNGVSGLVEKVKVTQVPSSFIIHTMGTSSSLQPGGGLAPGLNNKAMYHIRILVPPAGMILGFPPTEPVKFYDKNEYKETHYLTKNDEETSRMVSPSFELASQLGATRPMPYYYRGSYSHPQVGDPESRRRSATYSCAIYTETRKNKDGTYLTLDDWRLPTEAEIELIDKLQNDSKSAVKRIMTGPFYWDAYLGNKAMRMTNPDNWNTGADEDKAHVRCVRDVKDNTI